MKKALAVAFALSLASTVFAQADGPRHQQKDFDDEGIGASTLKKFPVNPVGDGTIRAMVDENDENLPTVANLRFAMSPEALRPAPLAVNLSYHGGDVINTAKVVCIFWGPTWASGGSDSGNAANIQSFRNQVGTSSHYSMLTQYYDTAYINTSNLQGSQPDCFDTTNPLPSNGNVTDSTVQAEVKRYITAHGSNSSTVYEVFLPKYVPGTSTLVYSSDGSSKSRGGGVGRPGPRLLRVSQLVLQRLVLREVLDGAVPELQRLPGRRLDDAAEHDALHGARDARGGHRSARQRLVRRQRLRGRRQVRLDRPVPLGRVRLSAGVVERRQRLRAIKNVRDGCGGAAAALIPFVEYRSPHPTFARPTFRERIQPHAGQRSTPRNGRPLQRRSVQGPRVPPPHAGQPARDGAGQAPEPPHRQPVRAPLPLAGRGRAGVHRS